MKKKMLRERIRMAMAEEIEKNVEENKSKPTSRKKKKKGE